MKAGQRIMRWGPLPQMAPSKNFIMDLARLAVAAAWADGELANEDLLRIWEVLGLGSYQLSVPYVARVVTIESAVPLLAAEGRPVQDRVHRRQATATRKEEP